MSGSKSPPREASLQTSGVWVRNLPFRQVAVHSANKEDSFVFYDIETLVRKREVTIGKTEIVSHHHLLSIAANKVINGTHTTEYWVLEQESEEGEQALVNLYYGNNPYVNTSCIC